MALSDVFAVEGLDGTELFTVDANGTVTSNNDLALASDSAVLSFGAGADASFTHDGTTGLDLTVTDNDSGAFTVADATGSLLIVDTTTNARAVHLPQGISRETYFELFDDFVGSGTTLPSTWASDNQTANSTTSYLATGASGVIRLATDATSEAQASQLTQGDALPINLSNGPIVECRFRYAPAGALPTADERFVIGVASAHATAEAALDTVTTNCWIRIEGADLTIYVEKDDGTDVDDQSSTITLVKSAWTKVKFDFTTLTTVGIYIDDVEQGGAALDMSGVGANTGVQFIACMQRDAGAEVNTLDIDYVRVTQTR